MMVMIMIDGNDGDRRMVVTIMNIDDDEGNDDA